MSRKAGVLIGFVAVLVAVGVFVWWFNRSPIITQVSLFPSDANVGEQVSLTVSVTGASRVRASSNLEELTPFSETGDAGVFAAKYQVLAAPQAEATILVAASRGWWGRSEATASLSINRPPRIEEALITLQPPKESPVQLDVSDPDGDSCV